MPTLEDEREMYCLIEACLPQSVGRLVSPSLGLRMMRSYWSYEDQAKVTAEALEITVQWRLAEKVDSMLREPVERSELYHRHWPTVVYGADTSGRLIYVERVSTLDTEALHRDFPKEEIRRNRAQDMEILDMLQQRSSVAAGRPEMCEHVHVFDLEGLTYARLTRRTINVSLDVINMSNAHYPGSLGTMFIVNAPVIFQMLWRLIRPMLAPETLKKTFILGGPEEYLPKMLAKGISLESLPTWTGKGTHPGVPLAAYVQAMGGDEAGVALPSTHSQLHLLVPAVAVAADAKTSEYAQWRPTKSGDATKRGRRFGIKSPVALELNAAGQFTWTHAAKRNVSTTVARPRAELASKTRFTVRDVDGREHSFHARSAEDAAEWVELIEAAAFARADPKDAAMSSQPWKVAPTSSAGLMRPPRRRPLPLAAPSPSPSAAAPSPTPSSSAPSNDRPPDARRSSVRSCFLKLTALALAACASLFGFRSLVGNIPPSLTFLSHRVDL